MERLSAQQESTSEELKRFEARIEGQFEGVTTLIRTYGGSIDALSLQVRDLNLVVGDTQTHVISLNTGVEKLTTLIDAELKHSEERWKMQRKSCDDKHRVLEVDVDRVRKDVEAVEDQLESTGRFELARVAEKKDQAREKLSSVTDEKHDLERKLDLALQRAENAERAAQDSKENVVWWRSNAMKLIVIILGLAGAGGVGAKVASVFSDSPPAASPHAHPTPVHS